MVQIIETRINNKWTLLLPEHRAARPEWPWWEQERLAAMHANTSPGDVVFDIGAEEGDFTALFSTWGATVVPFEPNPLVWPNIRCIWEANGLETPKSYFVGFSSNETNEFPSEMEEVIKLPEQNGWPGCAYGEIIGNHGFRNVFERFHDTPQIKMDDFARERQIYPDVITMDVEGAEFEVLKGAKEILLTKKPLVFVSIHSRFMTTAFEYEPGHLRNFMQEIGYVEEFIRHDHEEHVLFRPKT